MPRNRYIAVNQCVPALLPARAGSQILGRTDHDFFESGRTPQFFVDTDARALAGDADVRYERPYVHRRTTPVWMMVQKTAHDRGPTARAFVLLLMIDVTTRRADGGEAEARASSASRSLTEMSADWYWEQDAAVAFHLPLPHRAKDAAVVQSPARCIGKTRFDGPLRLGIRGRRSEAHRAIVAARQPFRDLVGAQPSARGRWGSVERRPGVRRRRAPSAAIAASAAT